MSPSRPPQPARAALAGGLAGALGLGVAELASGLFSEPVTPVLAVGQAVVGAVPGAVAERAIAVLGTWDKPFLVASVTLGALALSALAGVLAARRFALGMLLAVALVAVAVLAAIARPGGGQLAVLPALLGGLVALVALPMLLDALSARLAVTDVGAGARTPARRDVLRVGAWAGGLAVLGAVGGRWLGGRRRDVEATRAALRVPASEPVVPAGADLRLRGLTPWRTPVATFYRIDTALSPPLVHPDEWRLRVHGRVERELELSFDDLLGRRLSDAWVTLTCVSNEVGGSLAGNARWTGVRVADLLREAGVRSGADAVRSRSADGWTAGTPLDVLTDGRDALLAVAMDGQPLPVEHGFPVRMVVPGLYGYVSATKWLVDLEVTRFADFTAYWTDRGWSARGPVKTASRIDVPSRSADVRAGRVAVAGVAWAQHRGVAKVEVRVDDGPWRPARLAGVPSDDTWRQWVWEWDAAPGAHTLTVRATDGTGAVQTDAQAAPAPDGATGWHSVEVSVG